MLTPTDNPIYHAKYSFALGGNSKLLNEHNAGLLSVSSNSPKRPDIESVVEARISPHDRIYPGDLERVRVLLEPNDCPTGIECVC